jgi:hypothetical protein
VKTIGLDWEQEVMLYHHCDGYPTGIIPLLLEAWKTAPKDWESGRAGKVAGRVCATDPGSFEPESSMKFHSDIEWLYVLKLINKKNGSFDEKPRWILEIFVPSSGFWDKPELERMKMVFSGGLESVKAEEIENAE